MVNHFLTTRALTLSSVNTQHKDPSMSISPVSSSAASVSAIPQSAAKAPDGDSAAVEAAESAKTQQAEKNNGGVEPKAVAATSSATNGGLNKIV